MRDIGKKYRRVVLVYTNRKEDGKECCALKGGSELHAALKGEMKKADLTVRVSRSGCLDRCADGATVAIMPDDVWLGGTTEADIPEIVRRATSDAALDFMVEK